LNDNPFMPFVVALHMEEISTPNAPASIGPYSQGIVDGNTVYVSGQGPVDPESGDIVGETVADQTEQVLHNIAEILNAGGSSLENVVKATVYVRDMDHYNTVNEVYGEFMTEPFPARSAVEVRDLPIDIDVEIEVIATTS
jgi:2-iminobutanoate/2-iminopropanoate deaminase